MPTLLRFAGASVVMAPSTTTPTSLVSAASTAAITLSTFPAHDDKEWKSLLALPTLRSVSWSLFDVTVDDVSTIPAAFPSGLLGITSIN
jgi:hypothetical protein